MLIDVNISSKVNSTKFIFRTLDLFQHNDQKIKQNCQLSLTVTKYKTREDFTNDLAGICDYENYVRQTVRVGQTVRCRSDNEYGVEEGDTGVVRQVADGLLTVDWQMAGRQHISGYWTQLL